MLPLFLWTVFLAATAARDTAPPCDAPFALEPHSGEAHHGDVCRGPKGAWQCPRGCATSATGPLCVEDGRPCRRPAACLGRAALVAGRGSRGDACVVAQEKKRPYNLAPRAVDPGYPQYPDDSDAGMTSTADEGAGDVPEVVPHHRRAHAKVEDAIDADARDDGGGEGVEKLDDEEA